jgi:hypothetical protein
LTRGNDVDITEVADGSKPYCMSIGLDRHRENLGGSAFFHLNILIGAEKEKSAACSIRQP